MSSATTAMLAAKEPNIALWDDTDDNTGVGTDDDTDKESAKRIFGMCEGIVEFCQSTK